MNLKATARGAALDSVMQSLNGHFDANLAEGALEGVDLGYELARAQALAKGQVKQKLEDLLQKNGLGGLFGK